MGLKKTNHKVSVEASPEGLIQQLKKACGKPVRKTITFTNDDVPNYLKRLKQLEEKSRETRIIVS